MRRNNRNFNETLSYRLERGVERAIRKSLNECELDEGWRQAAIGGLMGLSVLGGAQSCSNLNHNEPVEQTWAASQSVDWKYNIFIGGEYEASVCDIHRGEYIKDVQINPNYYSREREACNKGQAMWPSWYAMKINDDGSVNPAYGLNYVKTYTTDEYIVEVYHTSMQSANGGDMSCYMEVYYVKDERLDPEEAIDYIEVYHQKNDRNITTFTVCLNDLKSDPDSPYLNVQ